MKFRLTVLSAAVLLAASCCAGVKPSIAQDKDIEKQVEKALSKMTLEDKIGQMLQLDFSVFMTPTGINYDLIDSYIKDYRVGSILNIPWSQAQTPQLYSEVIRHIQEVSMAEIGIPCLYGLDQNHGASYSVGATIFPQEAGLAATFNRENALNMGEIAAYETRACMVPWTFNPTMDLASNPAWPRIWESFGEDVYMNAEMGKNLTRGYQGEDPNHIDTLHMAACVKHFMAYGASVSGQDRTPSSVNDIDMRGRYFEPFKECFREGALSLMVNSGSNCGFPFHANSEYLTGWVKEELGWDGMIITDFNDLNNLYTREYIAKDKKDAIRIGINAGIDMVMEPYDPKFATLLKELVDEGQVSKDRIDDAARRVLRLKARLGLFEQPTWNTEAYDKYGCAEFAQKAYEAAVESEVLLKNEKKLLPLKEGTRILVAGPNANSMRSLNGGWSYTWQGSDDPKFTDQYNTIYEALCNRFGSKNVTLKEGVRYAKGKKWNVDEKVNIEQAVAAAKKSDVIVCCVGENSYCETPGNLVDLNLSENQKELVKALAATRKPLVLVLNEGRPRIINDLEPLASAIIDVLLPGNYGGDALAALLSGDENFSGRMPYTYPKYTNAMDVYSFRRAQQLANQGGVYDYDANIEVQWWFGEGLSYTSFEYSNLTLDKTEFKADDVLTFTIDVTNTGKRAGKEAVLLFSSDLVASVSPEVRRLREFAKIELQPGETRTVTFEVPASRLAFVNYDKRWTLEEGEFLFAIGGQSLKASCTKTYIWETPNID